MKLRQATMQDAEMLFAWRNDPETKRASHTIEGITLATHLSWLESSLANPTRSLWIAEEDGIALGTVRVDQHQDGIAELSWTVAPKARGRNVATQMVKMIAEALATTQAIRAEVKVGNIASVKVAEAAGMTLTQQIGEVLHFSRGPMR